MAGEILGGHMEELTKAIHNEYCENHPGMPYAVPWERLDESIRESNRAQARRIPEYLAVVGCGAGDAASPAVEAFTPAEIDAMARQVNRVWTQDKVAAGWTGGPVRDNERKIHPLLHVPWDTLPEAEKDKDRDIVRMIIPLLRAAGLRVYRK